MVGSDSGDVRKVALAVSGFVNSDYGEIKAFCVTMSKEHPTIQQGFTRLCVEWMRTLAAYRQNEYDLRNDASVELARAIIAQCGDKLYLPFI